MYSLRKRTRPAEKERAHKKEDDVSSLSSLSDSDVSEHDPAAHSVEESEDNFEAEEEGSKKNYKKKTAAKKAPVKRTLSAPVDTNRQAVPVQGSSRSKPARKRANTGGPPNPGSATRPYVHLRPAPLDGSLASSPTPCLSHLYLRITELIQSSRIEAGRDEALQSASQVAVEKSIGSLPSAVHRSALCLIMNRYSSFCASDAVDIPAFPVADGKVAIFLIRATATRVGASFRTLFPQPTTHPLPLSLGLDHTPLGKGEGYKVTRELVRSWIEALAYVQAATKALWDSQATVKSAGPLLAQPSIEEVLECFESGEGALVPSGKGKEREGESEEQEKKQTKWVKGGRPVDAPKKGSVSPPTLPPMMIHSSAATADPPPPSLAPTTLCYTDDLASTSESSQCGSFGRFAQSTYPPTGPPQHHQQNYYHSQPLPPPHTISPYPVAATQPQASTSHRVASLPIRPSGISRDQHEHEQQLHFQQKQQYALDMQRRAQHSQGRSSTFQQHELQQYSLYANPTPQHQHQHEQQYEQPQSYRHLYPSPHLHQQRLSPVSHDQEHESPRQERLPEPSRLKEGAGFETGRGRSTRFKSKAPPDGSGMGEEQQAAGEQDGQASSMNEPVENARNGVRQPSQAPEQVVPSHSDVAPPSSTFCSSYPADNGLAASTPAPTFLSLPLAAPSSMTEGEVVRPRPKPRASKNVYSSVLKADPRASSLPNSLFLPPAFPLPASPAHLPSPALPYPTPYPTSYPQSYPSTYGQPHPTSYPSPYQQYWTTTVPPPSSYYTTPAPPPSIPYRSSPYQSSYRTSAIPLASASPHYDLPSSSSYPIPSFSPHQPTYGMASGSGYESTSAYQMQSPRDGLGIDVPGGGAYSQGRSGNDGVEQEWWATHYSYGTPLSRENGGDPYEGEGRGSRGGFA